MNLRVRHQRNREGTVGVELNIMGLPQEEASSFGRSAFAVASDDNDDDIDIETNDNTKRNRAPGTGNGRKLVPKDVGDNSSEFPSRDDSAASGSQSEGGKRVSHWDGLDGEESLASGKHAPLAGYVDEEERVLPDIQ